MLGAVAMAALTACGGGGEDGEAPASPGALSDASTDVRAKVLVVRSSGGFVEQALTAGLRASDGTDYDILVIGGGTPLDPALKAQATYALEGGKSVVLDAGANGSNIAVGVNLKALDVGISSIDADAVLVTKASDGGYDIAPIESPQRASARMTALGTLSTEGINTVANLFGIDTGVAK